MMRIGLPNGILTSAQLRVIGELTKKYARNLADITTRQNIQLHWLTIESLPEVVDRQPMQLRSEEHTSELQSHLNLVCRLLLEKKKTKNDCHVDTLPSM